MPTPASPGTNKYRCNACGRHFNTESELKEHSVECMAAKQSGAGATRAADATQRDEDEDRDWVSTP